MVNQRWEYVMASIETEWKTLLGGSYDTLNLFTAGKGIGDVAVDFLSEMYAPDELLRDSEKRNVLISVMPAEYAEELVKQIDSKHCCVPGGEYSFLRGLKYDSRVENAFLNFFGIDKTPKPQQETVVGYETIDYSRMSCPLRNYQRQVLRDINSVFNAKDRESKRCMVQMPTGSGKTRTAMYYISDVMNSREEYMVLWLAYSKELCEQASDEFTKVWCTRGNKSVEIYRYYGDSSDFPTKKVNGIVITTLAKLNSAKNKNSTLLTMLADKIDLVVFDEAHQIIAPTYKSIVTDVIMFGSSKLIGLTATPGRTWDDPEEDRKLSEFFHYNIVRIHTNDGETPNQMLTDEGYLSRIKWVTCDCDSIILSREERDLIASLRNEDELPRSILERLSLDAVRNTKIVTAVEDLLYDGKKRLLIFSTSVEHSRILCGLLKMLSSRYNCKVSSIDSHTSLGEREKIIREFKTDSSEPRIICNYGVLTTGFDAPNIDAGVIARPTKSLVLFSQMVGRMIRGPKTIGGTSEATIVSVVDLNLPGFKDSYDNWQDVWS